jgi:hypothetical protein
MLIGCGGGENHKQEKESEEEQTENKAEEKHTINFVILLKR